MRLILFYFLFVSFTCYGTPFNHKNVETTYLCIKNSLTSYDDPRYLKKIFEEKSETARSCLIKQLSITLASDSLENALLEYAKTKGFKGDLKKYEGYGGGVVFSLIDKETPQFIIKAYPAASKQFVNDIWGQMAALSINLQSLHVPEILDITKVKVGQDEYILFVQEFAGGSHLWNLFDLEDKLAESYPSNKKKAVHVLQLLGKGMKDYHQKSTWKSAAPSYLLTEHLDYISKRGPQLIDEHPELGVNGSKVRTLLGALRCEINQRGIDWSFSHGDPHLGNFLYDENKDILSVIDLGDGAATIDNNFHGMGTPMSDFVKIEDYILSQSSKIGEADVKDLIAAFNEGYGIPSKGVIYQYFYIIDTLTMLNWYYHESNRVTDTIRQTMKASLDARLAKIMEAKLQKEKILPMSHRDQ